MRGKRYIWGFVIFLLSLSAVDVYAAEKPEVEPHLYEEQKINIETEYFHEDTLLQQKEDLPEEQRSLTFEPPENDHFYEDMEKQLFSSRKEINTIETTAGRLNLFQAKSEEQTVSTAEPKESVSGQPYWLIITLILLAAAAIFYMFFVLIPKVNKLSNS